MQQAQGQGGSSKVGKTQVLFFCFLKGIYLILPNFQVCDLLANSL